MAKAGKEKCVKITYSPDGDVAYIALIDIGTGGVAKSRPLDPTESEHMINLDFDSNNHLIGIEVIDASASLPREVLEAPEVEILSGEFDD